MKAILNTGSTVEQGSITKGGKKMSKEYTEKAALCYLNPKDFRELWYEKGSYLEKVKVVSEVGEVVLFVKPDEGIARGQIFVPRGPWSNVVISAETFGTGSPFYKGMEVEVLPTDEEVLDCKELFKGLKK